MASQGETNLARAGTMELTAQDGKLFLEKNLTDWKKPILMEQFNDNEKSEESVEEASGSKPAKKPKLSKHLTIKGTTKEAASLLASGGPDEDVFTRGQQKALNDIKNEKPSARKTKINRDNTMISTAKEGKALLGKEKVGSTRQITKKNKKTNLKRLSTIDAVVAEAKELYGSVDTSSERKLRRHSDKPTPLRKVGTMEKTAKEGKEFLSRKRKSSRK